MEFIWFVWQKYIQCVCLRAGHLGFYFNPREVREEKHLRWQTYHGLCAAQMSGLAPKLDKLATNVEIWGFLRSNFSTFLLAEPKCNEIWSEKIPGFVPFGTNLLHIGAKPGIPGRREREANRPSLIAWIKIKPQMSNPLRDTLYTFKGYH